MAEHPLYPYFGVSFTNGIVQFFSFYKDCKINLLTTFHLTKNPLDRIDFWEDGLLIVAGNLTIGEFFVIEVNKLLQVSLFDIYAVFTPSQINVASKFRHISNFCVSCMQCVKITH